MEQNKIRLISEKLDQAVELLKEYDIDCWITFTRESAIMGDPMLAFLASADVTWHSAFIVTSFGEKIAIVGKYDRAAVEELGVYDEIYDFVTGIQEPFVEAIWKIRPKNIALNYSETSEICDGLTYGMYTTITKMLKQSPFSGKIVSAEQLISSLRGRKSDIEKQHMQQAIDITLEIYEMIGKKIKPGVSERDLAEIILADISRRGLETAWEQTTCPAVYTGPDTAGAHYHPTDRKVEEGHLVNFDFGVKVNGYCSDLQRTWYVADANDSSVPAEVERGFSVLRESIERARAAMRPNVTGIEVDHAARSYIVENGYEEYPFGLGHQVGQFVHDGTALLGPAWEKYGSKVHQRLEEGMVFTIEPRLTVAGHGIVTMEEMVCLTADGAEYMSKPQTELYIANV
jgi:Xaa-Pro aminopeptidase